MSSGAQPASIVFPSGSGIDIYYTKLDRGVIVSGESHPIPAFAPYTFFLNYAAQSGTISIPGYTETTGVPLANQYVMIYSGTNLGLMTFNVANAGLPVAITYTANGDIVKSEYFNSLQSSVVNIENFIVSGLGISGNYLPITGGTVNGSITLNGGSLLTAVASGNQIGTNAAPFNEIHSENFIGNNLQDESGNHIVDLSSNVTLMSSSGVLIVGDDQIVMGSVNSDVDIYATNGNINFITNNTNHVGNVNPTVTSIYDLGSNANRWGTVYADNIDAPGFSGNFVSKNGDTMVGSLTIQTGSQINTNLINSTTTILSIESSGILSLDANSVSITSDNDITLTTPAANSVSLNGVFDASSAGILSSQTISPSISGTYDLGSSSNPFSSVYANNFVGLTLSGNFVAKAGDSMSGDLVMGVGATGTQPIVYVENIASLPTGGDLNIDVNALNVTAQSNIHFDLGPSGTQKLEIGLSQIYFSSDFVPTSSGTYDLGSPTLYIDTVYANNITAKNLTSGITIESGNFGDINFTGVVSFGSGSSITAVSGLVIGSSGSPVTTLYVDTIISNVATGTYLLKAGDTIAGDLKTSVSGTNDIGTAAEPFANGYFDNITSTGLNGLYVLKAGDTMTGPLVLDDIQSTGTLTILVTGTVDIYGNQFSTTVEQNNITSTVGPVIIDAQTEIQLLVNGTAKSVINASGTEVYDNIYPDISGTKTIGRPDRYFDVIYANQFVAAMGSGTGNYVQKIGDDMSGNLNFLGGADITTATSGTSDIATAALPFGMIYATGLYVNGSNIDDKYVDIAGDTMTGSLIISAGQVLAANGINNIVGGTLDITAGATGFNLITTGSGNITSQTKLILTSTASEIDLVGNGLVLNSNGSDTYIVGGNTHISGNANVGGHILPTSTNSYNIGSTGSMFSGVYASLISVSGSILPSASGTGAIGTSTTPWSGAYIKTINGYPATVQVYNETPAGTVDGVNATFYTAYSGVTNTERLYKGGLRMKPTSDYTMAGTGITFVLASIPASGANLLIDYERLIF